MKEFTIDLNGLYSADELQQEVEKVLPVPDYYGGTLDALADVLSEVSEDWRITWLGTEFAEAVMGKYIRNLKRMCERAAAENSHLSFQFQ